MGHKVGILVELELGAPDNLLQSCKIQSRAQVVFQQVYLCSAYRYWYTGIPKFGIPVYLTVVCQTPKFGISVFIHKFVMIYLLIYLFFLFCSVETLDSYRRNYLD